MIGLKTTAIIGGCLSAVIAAQMWVISSRGSEIKKLETKVTEQKITIEAYASKEELLEELRTQAAEIGSVAADACRKTINFRVKHTVESVEIQNAADDIAAAAAYDRILCQRPEAANHPKCTGADTSPE